MKWEELIAEARAAGVLKFCADGIAVLQRSPTSSVTSQSPIERAESSPGEAKKGESGAAVS